MPQNGQGNPGFAYNHSQVVNQPTQYYAPGYGWPQSAAVMPCPQAWSVQGNCAYSDAFTDPFSMPLQSYQDPSVLVPQNGQGNPGFAYNHSQVVNQPTQYHAPGYGWPQSAAVMPCPQAWSVQGNCTYSDASTDPFSMPLQSYQDQSVLVPQNGQDYNPVLPSDNCDLSTVLSDVIATAGLDLGLCNITSCMP